MIIKDVLVIYLGVRLRNLSSKKQRFKSKSRILAGFTTQTSKFVTAAIHMLQREERANIEKIKGCLFYSGKTPINQSQHSEMYFEAPIARKHIKWKSILEDSATCHENAAKPCHVACHVKGWPEEENVSDHAQRGWFYNAGQQTENTWNLMAPYRQGRTQSFI